MKDDSRQAAYFEAIQRIHDGQHVHNFRSIKDGMEQLWRQHAKNHDGHHSIEDHGQLTEYNRYATSLNNRQRPVPGTGSPDGNRSGYIAQDMDAEDERGELGKLLNNPSLILQISDEPRVPGSERA